MQKVCHGPSENNKAIFGKYFLKNVSMTKMKEASEGISNFFAKRIISL